MDHQQQQTPAPFTQRQTLTIYEHSTGAVIGHVGGLPFDHPAHATVRRLGWRALERAAAARQTEAMQLVARLVKDAGSAGNVVGDLVRQAAGRQVAADAPAAVATPTETPAPAEAPPAAAPAQDDPLELYSPAILVQEGLASLAGTEGKVTEADVDNLAPEAFTALARAVLRLSRPGAFDTEADRGNV